MENLHRVQEPYKKEFFLQGSRIFENSFFLQESCNIRICPSSVNLTF